MSSRFIKVISIVGLTAIISAISIEAKPLKVYILCGQSNMEGHAKIITFPAIAKDPKTADMYKDMVGADGKPVVCDNVWIADSYGDFSGNPVGKKSGKLTAGFGSQHHEGTGKIGPEFTFGIYMNKFLNEPILLIKDAWGGKSLLVDFRPPSAGEIANEKAKEKAGVYYKLLIDHVKEVLADPKKVYPNYEPKEGYELAGFVWFQGFNDIVGPYPAANSGNGKKGIRDYSEYSRLLSCFIRDVRKDLSAPKLPFVIGVLGVGGETAVENTEVFRKAMAAPGESPEFKGTVANVFTQKYWPVELEAILTKVNAIKSEFTVKVKGSKKPEKNEEESKQDPAKKDEEIRAKVEKTLTKDELFLLDNGISNKDFHYYGSAKFFGQIGKAFAESLVDLNKQKNK